MAVRAVFSADDTSVIFLVTADVQIILLYIYVPEFLFLVIVRFKQPRLVVVVINFWHAKVVPEAFLLNITVTYSYLGELRLFRVQHLASSYYICDTQTPKKQQTQLSVLTTRYIS